MIHSEFVNSEFPFYVKSTGNRSMTIMTPFTHHTGKPIEVSLMKQRDGSWTGSDNLTLWMINGRKNFTEKEIKAVENITIEGVEINIEGEGERGWIIGSFSEDPLKAVIGVVQAIITVETIIKQSQ